VKTLVLGLGNPLLTDDGVGLRVARELRSRLMGRPDVVVEEDYWGGLRLMERMVGYDRSIVIDAVCGGDTPGTVRCLRVQDMKTQHTASAHDATLSTALRFGHRVGAALPALDDVLIVAVEAADVTSFGEECTPQVDAAIPRAVETVLRELGPRGAER